MKTQHWKSPMSLAALLPRWELWLIAFWVILISMGCNDNKEPHPSYRLIETSTVTLQANKINSVPISLSYFPDSGLIALMGKPIYEREKQKKPKYIDWVDWNSISKAEEGDSLFIKSTLLPKELPSPRSICYQDDSTIYLFCQGYFNPAKIWILNRSGVLKDSIDISKFLDSDPSDISNFESLYVGPENPILSHHGKLELQSLPYSPILKSKNRNRHFFAYDLKEDTIERHQLSYPSEYYGINLSFGYQSPFSSLLDSASTLMLGFQASPWIYFYDLAAKKLDSISVKIPELPLSGPIPADSTIPLQKVAHGQYGPIYHLEKKDLFVRQFFLPFPEGYETHNKDSLNFPHNRPSSLVIFNREGKILNKGHNTYLSGLGQLGFYDNKKETLFIIRSKESKAFFEDGERKIRLAAFKLDEIDTIK